MDALANFYWLIGLLEGEGSFLAPSPSRPNELRVEIEMNDRDVIQRAAHLLGTSVLSRTRPRHRHGAETVEMATTYRTRVSGRRAVQLLHTIRPYMSARRQAQIVRALSFYNARTLRQAYESRQPYAFASLCFSTMCKNAPAYQGIWCSDCVRVAAAA